MSEEKPINLRRRFKPKGRGVDSDALAEVRRLLGDSSRRRDLLIEHLHKIQDACGCLSARHLAALAAEMKLSMAEVYEVATFYHHFDVVRESDSPPPPVTVRVCDSVTCDLFGGGELLRELHSQLGDSIRVIRAPCVGRCDAAPVAVVGQNPIEKATIGKVAAAAKNSETAATLPSPIAFDDYVKGGGYETLRECLEGKREIESVIKTLEDSKLRGLGGAGFPAGRKWRIVRAESSPRILAVNIDEGEPGTFKDRYFLERDPHRFLEGALIAAWAIDASAIYLYLRDEYHGCRKMLANELESLRMRGEVSLPELHLRRGAGAYICGEESAMIESIEGKKGMPRLRPPYVAQVGVFGCPTLEHNMETLYWVRDIIERGAEFFSANGRRGRFGLRAFSVSGRVKKPGVHLAPAGITVRELIDEFCGGMIDGEEFYAYLPGGASGGILPSAMSDIPLDFGTIQERDADCFIGSAAVIILSKRDRARDAAMSVMKFFEDESCGQCTPCRVGTAKAVKLMSAKKWDKDLLEELSRTMVDASICGLGQAAPNPIRCVVKHFADEVN